MNCRKALSRTIPAAIAAVLLVLYAAGSANARFHVPWQRPPDPPSCARSDGREYFRPEYGELAERLPPEKLAWLSSSFPILGWQGMDPRIYRPKRIPGSVDEYGFSYDAVQRNIKLEAVFHFGPRGGNGTLIEHAMWLDEKRILTVNRGSDNLSVIDTEKPDILGTLEAPRGIVGFDVNPAAGELYLVERSAKGMLIFDLDRLGSPTDTLGLGFEPGAVLQFPGDRWLYFTDPQAGELVRFDLSGEEQPARLEVDAEPPLLMAYHPGSATIVLVAGGQGDIRLVDAGKFQLRPDRLDAGREVTSLRAGPGENTLLLTSAGRCEDSRIHSLSVADGTFTLERVATVRGIVRDICTTGGGWPLYAVAGRLVYRIGEDGQVGRTSPGPDLRGVAAFEDRVYVAGGLDDVYMFEGGLDGEVSRARVEMGPGPLLLSEDRLYAFNSLSSSVTVLRTDDLREDVSVLVGVLLGRMFHIDDLIVVNNCFRGNVMVLNPYTYRIEEIIGAGGSLHYDAEAEAFAVFGDTTVARLPSPPRATSVNTFFQISGGVRLFVQVAGSDRYIVADQDRSLNRLDLFSTTVFRHAPLPAPALGMQAVADTVYVSAPTELYSLTAGDNIGLDRTWSVKPFRMSAPWLAAEGFSRGRGSLLKYVTRRRLLDVFTTRGEISAIRLDPDTTRAWVAAGGAVHVFDTATGEMLSTINLRWPISDVFLPAGGPNAYLVSTDQVSAVDRANLLRYDDVPAGGELVYARGDFLFLMHPDYERRLVVADGARGNVWEQEDLPVVPTDAAGTSERLFLLGGTQGAIAIYVNLLDSARMPRGGPHAWDDRADERANFHR